MLIIDCVHCAAVGTGNGGTGKVLIIDCVHCAAVGTDCVHCAAVETGKVLLTVCIALQWGQAMRGQARCC